jgi:hypothetical protein
MSDSLNVGGRRLPSIYGIEMLKWSFGNENQSESIEEGPISKE